MSKFNVKNTKVAKGNGPIAVAVSTPTTVTYEGAPAYGRNTKSELFLLAVANFVGENSFYEKADDRDARYRDLVHAVAVADPEWTAKFLGWLRGGANMRSASLVGALEAAKAMLFAGIPGARQIVASVLQRADEPGEAMAYWLSTYGRPIPKPVKRGLADAAIRVYSERNLLKYDTASHGVRFGDVIDMVRPDPRDERQSALFKYAIDRRHGHGDLPMELWKKLPMITAQSALRVRVTDGAVDLLLQENVLREAGMTWEDALSLAGSTADKKALWEAMIPSMGYMALLRNLRNFDEAGVSDEVAATVAAKLSDPGEVAKSRQFPYRFLAAYEAAPSLRWGPALDKALNLALSNVPVLDGGTLVLIDTSASMTDMGFTARSKMTPAKAAAVFGVVLAARSGADLYGFADGQFRHDVPKGASVIREIDRFVQRTGEVGHGTQIAVAIKATFDPNKHKRVFVISDMQTFQSDYYSAGPVTNAVPASVPIYGVNLGGYAGTVIDAGNPNRIEFGGLTDAMFKIVPLIEAGRDGSWPWAMPDAGA